MKAFKFHFDSINIAMREAKESIVTEFKFHFDSINIINACLGTSGKGGFKFHFDSINIINPLILGICLLDLNSTLILLIYAVGMIANVCKMKFKFHFDSINIRRF